MSIDSKKTAATQWKSDEGVAKGFQRTAKVAFVRKYKTLLKKKKFHHDLLRSPVVLVLSRSPPFWSFNKHTGRNTDQCITSRSDYSTSCIFADLLSIKCI